MCTEADAALRLTPGWPCPLMPQAGMTPTGQKLPLMNQTSRHCAQQCLSAMFASKSWAMTGRLGGGVLSRRLLRTVRWRLGVCTRRLLLRLLLSPWGRPRKQAVAPVTSRDYK